MDKPKRMIIVMSCGHCPISRLMRIKDGPFCGHQATDGMEVGGYSDSIHPDCPLREGGDTPQLLEKLEITEQLLTDAITGHDKMLELKNALAEQNEKLLEALKEVMASRVITGMGAAIRGESRRKYMLPDIPSPSSKKKDIPLTAQSNLIPYIAALIAETEGGG